MKYAVPCDLWLIPLDTAAGFPYQSGVIDGDDEVKKRLQSCTVSRRVLLNLHKIESESELLLDCDTHFLHFIEFHVNVEY